MNYNGKKAENIKIAYVGGGSRGWAWGLMSDLVACEDMSGDVYLYDIDMEAAEHNEIIGNMYNELEGAKSRWNYQGIPDHVRSDGAGAVRSDAEKRGYTGAQTMRWSCPMRERHEVPDEPGMSLL